MRALAEVGLLVLALWPAWLGAVHVTEQLTDAGVSDPAGVGWCVGLITFVAEGLVIIGGFA